MKRTPVRRRHAPAWPAGPALRQARAGGRRMTAIREFVCGLSPIRSTCASLPAWHRRALACCACYAAAPGPTSSSLLTKAGLSSRTPWRQTTAGGGLASNIGLVVADAWQQQGLGTLLLSTLIGRASRRGIGSLVLDVLPSNAGCSASLPAGGRTRRGSERATQSPSVPPSRRGRQRDAWPVPMIVPQTRHQELHDLPPQLGDAASD